MSSVILFSSSAAGRRSFSQLLRNKPAGTGSFQAATKLQDKDHPRVQLLAHYESLPVSNRLKDLILDDNDRSSDLPFLFLNSTNPFVDQSTEQEHNDSKASFRNFFLAYKHLLHLTASLSQSIAVTTERLQLRNMYNLSKALKDTEEPAEDLDEEQIMDDLLQVCDQDWVQHM